MNDLFANNFTRVCVATMLAASLGACATTQRTSSGLGTTDEAKAAPSPTAAAQASAAPTDVQPASAPVVTAEPTHPMDVEDAAQARRAASASDEGATRISSEEIDREKRALAAEEANINKLHAAEELDKQRMDAELASTAVAASPTAAPVTTPADRPATTAARKPDDAQVVFPEDRNAEKLKDADAEAVNAQPTMQEPAQIQPESPLQRSVYFDFDKASIKEQYDPLLKAHATFLESHKKVPAEIQGNCDERGSREYNLALGARRAEAVKQALELLGVDGNAIKTVSFGSEKPIAPGKGEDSYSLNRRADILY